MCSASEEISDSVNTVDKSQSLPNIEAAAQRPGHGFLAAYLIHLIGPSYLVFDVLFGHWFGEIDGLNPTASLWPSIGPINQAVLVGGLLWLLTGLCLFFFVSSRKLTLWRLLHGPLIAIYGIFITLACVELVFQIMLTGAERPALWPEGRDALLKPDPTLMPGISGAVRFTANDEGVRGTPFPDGDTVYKIITVGGSTTEDLYLDDEETWSNLLMNELNQSQDNVRVWVGNAGQSGRNTADHLALLQSLPVFTRVDLVIFLVGINDLGASVSFDGASTKQALRANAEKFKRQILNGGNRMRPARPYFKRSQIYDRLRSFVFPTVAELIPVGALSQVGAGPGSFIQAVRLERANGVTVRLPDLEVGLEEYADRIHLLGDECIILGVRCLFMTQPSMYREDLSEKEDRLLWGGWVQQINGSMGYVSAAEMSQAVEAINRKLLSVCSRDELECFRLAQLIPKDTTAFYDDVHFNENGARLVAGAVTDYLLQDGLYK